MVGVVVLHAAFSRSWEHVRPSGRRSQFSAQSESDSAAKGNPYR